MGSNRNHIHKCAGGCCGHEVEKVPMTATAEGIGGVSRRNFLMGLGTAAVGAWALQGCATTPSAVHRIHNNQLPPTRTLTVQPVLVCSTYSHRDKTSWRPWGGIQTDADIEQEKKRIDRELAAMAAKAEFSVSILPVAEARNADQAKAIAAGNFDTTLIYAAGSGGGALDPLVGTNRPSIMFLRHRSGPVYLWYEIVHPRFLRKTVDEYGQPGMDVHDVVVDEYDDVLWRLRALYGLKNACGERIIAIGDASGWGQGGRNAPDLAREKWHMEIIPVSYDDLGKRFQNAMADEKRMARCRDEAAAYMQQQGITLETKPEFVERCMVVTDVFKELMAEANVRAITVNNCMGTIMRVTETTACLPLSILNDEGYMAFCESDFVVIPSGVLLHHISGLPVFLNDPTTPHHGCVTLAHCTAPRKLDGRAYEKTRVMTHFESDYGASPKVEMTNGRTVTVIDPDFAEKRWMGFRGKTIETPFMDICRAQVDVEIEGDWVKLLEEMRGFHWMMSYGDYLKETGYALKKAGIEWVDVTNG